MKSALAALCLCVALPVLTAGVGFAAPSLVSFPVPVTPIGERVDLLADTAVPVGPWRAGEVASIAAEGQVSQTTWRLEESGLSTLDVMNDLEAQLTAKGFEVLYECRTRSCGGFDFRFGIDVLPEPQMHVDLGDYRFLSARRGTGDAAEYATLMVSRSSQTGFVQVTHVAPPLMLPPEAVLSTRSASGVVGSPEVRASYGAEPLAPSLATDTGGLVAALEQGASVPLDDLTFQTGSTQLGAGPFASLKELARFLQTNPDLKITLVGHSDTLGGLEENIALSRQRANSVAQVLVRDYGIDRSRVDAEGVGYLAPRASNRTDDGRSQNRRVEALLTSLD